jgi:hypothetical protein
MVTQVASYFSISPRRLLQPSVGYISCALLAIAGTIYWWHKRTSSLATRVQKHEEATTQKSRADFENIFLNAAHNAILFPGATTPNEWKERVLWLLETLHEEVQKQPSNVPSDFQQRLKSLLESTKSHFKNIQPSPTPLNPPTSQDRTEAINLALKEELLHLNWTEIVDKFEALFRDCESFKFLKNDQILDHFKNYQTALLLQIQEILRREKKLQGKELSSDLFFCLYKIHTISRRLLTHTKEISTALLLTSSLQISGLPNSRNSCYLATALQFLRILNVTELDPEMKKPIESQDDLNTKIKKTVCNIVVRMSRQQPIAKEGAELQNLITQARINADSVAAQNDASEVAIRILGLFGFHLPVGIIQEERKKSGKATFDSASFDDFRPALSIPKNEQFDVGAAIENLTKEDTESVENFGDIRRKVTKLPNHMFVTFSCRGQFRLANHLEFDDPLNPGYYYQLVFGMENNTHFGSTSTSGHWISHLRDDRGQWIVANDERISHSLNPPQQLRYGYYVRKSKLNV